MASTSARRQLVRALPELFADKDSEFRGNAALEINQMHDDVAAGLLDLPEEDRRAAIMAAVRRAAAAAGAAGSAAAAAGSLRALVEEAVEGVKRIEEGFEQQAAINEQVLKGMSTLSLMSQQAYLSVYDTRSQSSRNSNSRQDAAVYYGALAPDTVPAEVAGNPPLKQFFCCVTGQYLREDKVKAAHIYQHSWPSLEAAQLKIDKESVRNILLMHTSVEKALDHKRLVILPEGDAEYKVVLLDKRLEQQWIVDHGSGQGLTFKDIHMQRLHWLNDRRPYKRSCLAHARHALMDACAFGWVEPGQYSLEAAPRSPNWGCDAQLLSTFFADEQQLAWPQLVGAGALQQQDVASSVTDE